MDTQEYISQKKEFYNLLLEYIDKIDENFDEEKNNFFIRLDEIFLNDEVDPEEIKLTLRLVLKISNNHYRSSSFDKKINEIISHLSPKIKQTLTNFEIFDSFKSNRRILLYLIQNQILTIDQDNIDQLLQNSMYCHFFYPEIKAKMNIKEQEKNEKAEVSKYKSDFGNNINFCIFIPSSVTSIGYHAFLGCSSFNEKRQIGENDSCICTLIRKDLIDEFVTYITQSNYPIRGKVPKSIFETNSFLLKNNSMTLIEYVAFFGSIQIFKYLRVNEVEMTPFLRFCAIHSNNEENIYLLQESHIKLKNEIIKELLIESIKCHHNTISDYIQMNLIKESQESLNEKVTDCGIHYLNYYFFPEKVDTSSFFYFALYKYDKLVNIYIEKKKDEIEEQIIRNYFKKNKISTKIIILNGVLIGLTVNGNQIDVVYYLLSKLNKIEHFLFQRGDNLYKLAIPSSIKAIEEFSFDGFKSLTNVLIPSSITTIERFVFRDTSLRKVVIPSSVTELKDFAFRDSSLLEKVSFGIFSSLQTIGKFVFDGCPSLTRIIIPSSVKKIDEFAFRGCKSIKQIKFMSPSSLTHLGMFVFDYCTALTNFTIPSSVVTIDKCLFRGCKSLTVVSFESPSSIKFIGENIFCICPSLRQVIFPSCVDAKVFELEENVILTKIPCS